MTIKVEDNKIIFSRTIEAPIEKVFDAYTTKALFEKWFHQKTLVPKCFALMLFQAVMHFMRLKHLQ